MCGFHTRSHPTWNNERTDGRRAVDVETGGTAMPPENHVPTISSFSLMHIKGSVRLARYFLYISLYNGFND